MVGSTELPLIWKVKTTPAGRSISRLAPWTPPKSDSGNGGSVWTTVTLKGDYNRKGLSPQAGDGIETQMIGAATLSVWSTARASDGEKGGPNMSFGAGGQPLPAQMYMTWPLPTARDWRSDRSQQTSQELYGSKGRPLSRMMIEASGEVQGETAQPGPAPNGSSATTAKRGAPNPDFAFWLMGWPAEFRRGVLAAIASRPSSRRK